MVLLMFRFCGYLSCHKLRERRDNTTYCYKMIRLLIVFNESMFISDAAPVADAENYIRCLAVFVEGFINFTSNHSTDAFHCSIRNYPSLCAGNANQVVRRSIMKPNNGFIYM